MGFNFGVGDNRLKKCPWLNDLWAVSRVRQPRLSSMDVDAQFYVVEVPVWTSGDDVSATSSCKAKKSKPCDRDNGLHIYTNIETLMQSRRATGRGRAWTICSHISAGMRSTTEADCVHATCWDVVSCFLVFRLLYALLCQPVGWYERQDGQGQTWLTASITWPIAISQSLSHRFIY